MADIINGTQSDWLAVTQNAFRDGRDYFNAGIRRELERDVRQFQGMHPADSKYLSPGYQARSRFFRPKTRATIRKNEAVAAAALFSNADTVEITPWDDESPLQRAAAELHKELLNLRLKRFIPWFHVAIGGYQVAQVEGVVSAHIYWKVDAKRGIDEPCVDLIPSENLVISPSSLWFDPINSSPYVIHMIPMLVKDVTARMHKIDPNKTSGTVWNKLDDSVILQGVRAYSDSIRLERESRRPDSQAQSSALTPYQVVWVYRTIADIDGVDYEWYSLGETALLTDGHPLSKSCWHGKRPYVMGYSVLEAHKIYPPGVARLTRELQAELNENANQRSDNVKFAMNKRYFGRRGSQLDIKSLTRNVPGSVTLMNDPEKDVQVHETQDVTQSAYEEQDRLNIDFDELAGSNSKAARGDPNDLSNKVGGAELLTEDQNQIEGYQLRTYVETFIEPALTQIMLLEQHYETDAKILAMCGRKAGLNEHGVTDIDDNLIMQELALTVHVGIGSTSPRKQLDNLLFGFAKIKELLETPTLAQYGLDVEAMMNEIFGKLGYRTAERFFKWDNQDPQIVALNSQVQQLTDALKNKKDPPEIVAAKVQLLTAQVKKTLNEAFNVNVEGLFGSMQAAEVVAAVPAVAPVADTIAKAAGYEPPVPTGADPGIQPAGAGSGAADPSAGDGGVAGNGAPTPSVGPNAVPNAPAGPAPGITINPHGVTNAKTGIGFMPGNGPAAPTGPAVPGGIGANGLPAGVGKNTDPLHPAMPGHPDVGVNAGIKGGQSANPARALAAPPADQSVDTQANDEVAKEERAHRRAMDLVEHTAKVKAKYAPKEDNGRAAAAEYDKKKADKAKSEKDDAAHAKAQEAAEKKAEERHQQSLKAMQAVTDRQNKIEERLSKPKPKVVINRDASGNITSFEPQG